MRRRQLLYPPLCPNVPNVASCVREPCGGHVMVL